MSLIEINPDLRRLTTAAERIAFTLEQIALAEYGIHPKPKDALLPARATTDDDIAYATNEGTLRQEMEELVMPGTVHERDGTIVDEEVGSVLDTHRRT